MSALMCSSCMSLWRCSNRIMLLNTRLISTSAILYSNKRRTRKKVKEEVVFKHKKINDFPVLPVWIGMTLKDLSIQLNVDTERIFECILDTQYADTYTKSNQPVSDPHLLNTILTMNKRKANFVQAPSQAVFQKEEKDLDAYASPPADPSVCKRRPPVVTIMGHVDHGKTTLLDALRRSRIVDTEFGGITQHIGAFSVRLPLTDNRITFLDTPGHAAFHEIRRRGANATDLVVLVVAADDGVMDQTRESILYARQAQVPIIVAINKCDKYNADIKRTKDNLLSEGLILEEFQGDVQAVCISALEGTNLTVLQEAIITQAELLDIKADYSGFVEGTVIEAAQKQNKGKISTVLVQRGILKKGDYIVAGQSWCKVRAILDEFDKQMNEITPGNAAQIMGWRDTIPVAGDVMLQVEGERRAREVVNYRLEKLMDRKVEKDMEVIAETREVARKEYLVSREAKLKQGVRGRLKDPNHFKKLAEAETETELPTLALLIKADVTSSLEAIQNVFNSFSSTMLRLDIIDEGIGPPTTTDVMLAKQFTGSIVTFNVPVPSQVLSEADKEGVQVQEYNVIYRLVDSIKDQLSKLLPLKEEEKILGQVDVVKCFEIKDRNKKVLVAGCICNKGHLDNKQMFRIVRDGHVVHEGTVKSMKTEKQVVTSVNVGQEVGIMFDDVTIESEVGDVIVCYTINHVNQTVDWYPPGF